MNMVNQAFKQCKIDKPVVEHIKPWTESRVIMIISKN